MAALELRVLSINVAQPRLVGERNAMPLMSAFEKRPVAGPAIAVRVLGLEGDGQADQEKHGGPDRAVYAYPADNWPWWEKEKGLACSPGLFGENLTLAGADEDKVRIGDRFSWGEILLEVTQPRTPCHKFQRFSGREDASAIMTISGRCGWHFRVLTAGVAPAEDGVLTRIGESRGPSVREVFLAVSGKTSPQRRLELAAARGLADEWRNKLLHP